MAVVAADFNEQLIEDVSPSPSDDPSFLPPSFLSTSDFLLLCILFLLIALSSIFIVTFILRLIYKRRFEQQMRRHLGIFALNSGNTQSPALGESEKGGVYVVRPPVMSIPLYDDVFSMPPAYGQAPPLENKDANDIRIVA